MEQELHTNTHTHTHSHTPAYLVVLEVEQGSRAVGEAERKLLGALRGQTHTLGYSTEKETSKNTVNIRCVNAGLETKVCTYGPDRSIGDRFSSGVESLTADCHEVAGSILPLLFPHPLPENSAGQQHCSLWS